LSAYTDVEMSVDPEQQFADVVTPPMFFLLSLLIAHGLELATHVRFVELKSELSKAVFASDTTLLVFRAIAFSLFPLLMANGMMRRLHQPVDRNTLRRPFYIQCYFAAPFVVLTSVAVILMQWQLPAAKLAGAGLWLAASTWYLVVEARWFSERLGVSRARGFASACKLFALALLGGLAAGLFVVGPEIADAIGKN
jgi:hypothetical protein